MRYLQLALVLVAGVGCVSPLVESGVAPSSSMQKHVGLVTLDEVESRLASAFNHYSERAQLVVILSPT